MRIPLSTETQDHHCVLAIALTEASIFHCASTSPGHRICPYTQIECCPGHGPCKKDQPPTLDTWTDHGDISQDTAMNRLARYDSDVSSHKLRIYYSDTDTLRHSSIGSLVSCATCKFLRAPAPSPINRPSFVNSP